MKEKTTKHLLKKIGSTLLFSAVLANTSSAQTMYAVQSNTALVTFNTTNPQVFSATVGITGITAGQTIEGLDFRPNTGQLYAFGYNKTTTSYQLYTINRTTGVATALNTETVIALGNGPIGFDFNPTVDRIRVTSANNGNFRLHPVTGLIVFTDGSLAYNATDVNAAMTPKIVAGAYTNSYIGSAVTTLYNYDNLLNIITTQIPPNNGTLNTIGASGIITNTVMPLVDMDIYYNPTTSSNMAYLVANTSASVNTSQLHTINLATGALTLVGDVGGVGANPVSNIAVFIDRTEPAMVGQLAYALSGTNLVTFDTQNPSFIRSIMPVTGVAATQTIVGMDMRPLNNMLYVLGYNATANESQLYTINPATGVATVVNSTPTSIVLGAVNVGLDFNPVVDKIRIVSNDNQNYRLDPTTGTLTATDANLAFASTDVNFGAEPNAGSIAYINSYGTPTTTTLYNYEENLNIITTQIPPNNGTLNTIGSSGIMINMMDATLDLDIFYEPTTQLNTAYLAANTGTTTNDNLYSVNLSSGVSTLIGKIGYGIPVRDITIQIATLTTGIAKTEAHSKSFVSVFPNPLSDNTIVSVNDGAQADVNVFDITGRTIEVVTKTELLNNNLKITWNTAVLNKGIYFLQVIKPNGDKQVIKLVK